MELEDSALRKPKSVNLAVLIHFPSSLSHYEVCECCPYFSWILHVGVNQEVCPWKSLIVYCLKQQNSSELPWFCYPNYIRLAYVTEILVFNILFCLPLITLTVQVFSWTNFYSVFAICILLRFKTMFHNRTQLNILYLNPRLYMWYHYVVTWYGTSDTLALWCVLWQCEINVYLIDSLC